MTYKNIGLRKTYSSDDEDILNDFYIPILKESNEYCRLAGFFSSTSLAVAAKGILGLIKNNGCMKMIISPRLSERDLEIIISSYQEPEKFIIEKIVNSIDNFENEFIKSHLYALGWMVANKKLFIKVAIPNKKKLEVDSYKMILKNGIFHQKVGILRNSLNETITFSGSINESATGWLGNVEEFKVFRSWEPVESEFASSDINKFEKFWENRSTNIEIIEMPKVLEEKFIKIAPDNINDFNFDKVYEKYYPRIKSKKRKKIILFPHQVEAINSWVKKGFNGIFAMATGTGKTFTALGCVKHLYSMDEKLVTIISAPYKHLVQQWKKEINDFNLYFDKLILAGSYRWKNEMYDSLAELSFGHISRLIIITTHDSFCSKDFIDIVNKGKYNSKILLIADEVHGIGSKERRKGLNENYQYRLGLSATPRRWFDEEGTKSIYDFFGDDVFEFTLRDAITNFNSITGKTFLTPYKYLPKFFNLDDGELDEYYEKTKSIVKIYHRDVKKRDEASLLDMLLFGRANIIKNANMKFTILEDILKELLPDIKWTIIYCTPQQIDNVMQILKKFKIIAHRFTEKEGTEPEKKYKSLSEREYILEKFAEGRYDVLVAMKCLDEGVDVPPARKAILMASSGNPREYIQRIGRIIRRYKDKEYSILYDLIVYPPKMGVPTEILEIENRIFEKEKKRYLEIAKTSMNCAEALKLINDMEK